MQKFIFIVMCGLCSFSANCGTWIDYERPIALAKMISNIHPSGTAPGIVVASPDRSAGAVEYFYHWTRDAALVMDVVVRLNERDSSFEGKIWDYIHLSKRQQESNAISGLGEPKYEPDGAPFMGNWGRPQNDGPALRAITLMRYSRWLQSHGRKVDPILYDGAIPAESVIKRDLEFISHHWREASFDLWEEVLGDHFYTRMVQRRALLEGVAFARSMGDGGAADWYARQAAELTYEIRKHFDGDIIIPTLNRKGGVDYKNSHMDVAVLLGALHGHTDDGFLPFNDARLLKYTEYLVGSFAPIYSINQQGEIPGIAVGRYPEDRYAGLNFNGGNPWVLATLAVAEVYARAGMFEKAFPFIERVRFHAFPDGSLSEQMDRGTGFMTSAADLTWNYAAVLTLDEALHP